MTGIEMQIAKELILWGAKAFFDAVNDEKNSFTADQAKQHSKNAMSELSEQAQKAILHNLPKHFKL